MKHGCSSHDELRSIQRLLDDGGLVLHVGVPLIRWKLKTLEEPTDYSTDCCPCDSEQFQIVHLLHLVPDYTRGCSTCQKRGCFFSANFSFCRSRVFAVSQSLEVEMLG